MGFFFRYYQYFGMIILNKNIPINTLILNHVGEGVNTLILHYDYTLEDITIQLNVNQSLYLRYSKFEVENTSFSQLITGLYSYSHQLNGEVISIGMLKVISNSDEVIYNTIEDEVDDYNVFRG